MHYFKTISSASGAGPDHTGGPPWTRWVLLPPDPLICLPLEKNSADAHVQ